MRLYLSLLLCFAFSVVFAQNTIEGNVTDAETNSTLSGCNIYLPELEKGASTDEHGSFNISNLPNGSYNLIVSFIGYQTQSVKITLPSTTPFNFNLTPSAIEIKDVIISTPFHKLQSENVMKVEQVKIDDLKSNGAMSLSDGLTNIPGVENLSTGISIGKPVIRGLSFNRVLVYTQGIRLENQQFGDEHGLGLSDDGVESVEVIKGPASLLYGSDALGGVIYFNPEKFAPVNSTLSEVNSSYYSNTLGNSIGLASKTSGNKLKFLVRGNITQHSDYKTKDYRVTNTRFKEKDFKFGAGYQSTKFKTEIRYNFNDLNPGIPEELGEQSKSKTPLLPNQEIVNNLLSSKSTFFLDNSKIDVNLGYTTNHRKEFEEDHEADEDHDALDVDQEVHEEGPALFMKLKTLSYDVKYTLPDIGKFEIIAGVQGMHQTNSNFGEEELIPNATTNDIGVMAASHYHLNENLDFQLGTRFDNRSIAVEDGISKNYKSFNGALGIKSNITKHFIARLNLASGFRAPNLAELTSNGVHEGTFRYEIGNPDLRTEQNFQTDLNLEYYHDNFELFINGFRNSVNNYIYINPNGQKIDETPVYDYVQNNAKLYGGEAGFHLHPNHISWLHFESSFETVTGKRSDGSYLPLIPANNLNNTLRVTFSNKWFNNGYTFVKLSSTFKQANINTFETETNGYNLISAGLGGSFKILNNDATLNIVGTNLTNKAYISHLSRLKPDNIYNIGRNFLVSLNIKF